MPTAQAIIDELRLESLNDASKDRYSDARVLGNLNDFFREACVRRPDLFATQGTVATVSGVYQVAPADSVRLMDVMQVQGGRMVRETDQEVLDCLDPIWRAAVPGSTKNWMRYHNDPNRFMVTPPAPASAVTLVVLYAKVPAPISLGDAFPIPDVYIPAAKHYMVYKIEMPQDESVLSGRAQMEFAAFESLLAASVASKGLTDNQKSRKDQRA